MEWKDVASQVGKFAPYIATALGGPAAGLGVKALCSALGMDATTTSPDDVAKLFANGQLSGDQLLAMKKAEQDFQLQLKALDINSIKDLEALADSDRASARDRETKVRDHTPEVGFYLITLGFFGLLALMLFHVVPESNTKILDIMTGSLGTAWIGAVQYFYGTTHSSGIKDQMIYNSTPRS